MGKLIAAGVAEYLFRSPTLLQSAITAAVSDKVHRPDDVEFTIAARGWSECVSFGNFDLYQRRFEETASKCSLGQYVSYWKSIG